MLGLYSPEEILKIPSHPCMQEHISAHPHTPAYTHTCPHKHTPAKTCTNPCGPMQTCTYPHICLRIPAHTNTHLHTLHIYTLNLINQIKLHVNRPSTKKNRKEDRKKMEQESTEAISRLKILFISNIMLT